MTFGKVKNKLHGLIMRKGSKLLRDVFLEAFKAQGRINFRKPYLEVRGVAAL